jgi:hypothetical protein
MDVGLEDGIDEGEALGDALFDGLSDGDALGKKLPLDSAEGSPHSTKTGSHAISTRYAQNS